MLQQTEQTKDKFCIALMNSRLNANNRCPANHSVEYWGDGLFGIDGKETEALDIAIVADALFDDGDTYVMYSATYNSYVFGL